MFTVKLVQVISDLFSQLGPSSSHPLINLTIQVDFPSLWDTRVQAESLLMTHISKTQGNFCTTPTAVRGTYGVPAPLLTAVQGTSWIPAPLLTAVQGTCWVPAPLLIAVQGTCWVPAPLLTAILSWRHKEDKLQIEQLGFPVRAEGISFE